VRKYLLDTNAVSDFVNDRRGVRKRAIETRRRGARVGTCFPALAELFYGIELSATRDANMALARLGVVKLTLWPFDQVAAAEYGRIAAELRRTGRPMQQVDIMVAAIALALGDCTVVTTDSDLSAVPGLRVEDWTAPPAP
jgi:tRNA(fMet)-specific endonuclease VapC